MPFWDPRSPEVMSSRVRSEFRTRYGREAAVVARAPGRVNLIGEHTDYNGGPVLPVALPHATYVAAAAREDGTVHLAGAQADAPWRGRLDEIGPGRTTGWAAYAAGVLWALRGDGLDVPGVDLWIDSTVPVGAGLSSSAALECAVAVACCGLLAEELTPELRERLASACVRAETEVAGAPTGGMDQAVALHARAGAALHLDFGTGERRVVPLHLAERVLLVTDTRVSHALVDGGYADRRTDCEAAARTLGLSSLGEAEPAAVAALTDPRLRARARHVVTEVARVSEAVEAFRAADWGRLGHLFAASHASLRDDFEVSCPELDLAVDTAYRAGADAARMTGGGFGGSTVTVVRRDRVSGVVAAVDEAFAAHAHRPPAHLVVEPAAGAALC